MAEDYQPIACAQHERLEFSVLRKIWLDLAYAGKHERVLPLDVTTRDGAEWLKFRQANGSENEIRLDRIESFKEVLS